MYLQILDNIFPREHTTLKYDDDGVHMYRCMQMYKYVIYWILRCVYVAFVGHFILTAEVVGISKLLLWFGCEIMNPFLLNGTK